MPKKLDASLVMLNLPSDNPTQTRDFLSSILGLELIPTLEDQPSYHAPISEDGIDIFTGPRRSPQEQSVPYFHVDDLDQALQRAQDAGGNVVWGPENVAMSDEEFGAYSEEYKKQERGGPEPRREMARAAVVVEPGGGQIGLMQVQEHMHSHYQVGRHQKALTDKQLAHMEAGKAAARRIGRDRDYGRDRPGGGRER